MLADSLEHAFEDMSKRSWTEAELKANEMLKALDAALAANAGDISAGERESISSARAEVAAALAAKNLTHLQKANSTLDAATQNLAAISLEKAIERTNQTNLYGSIAPAHES